MTTVTSPGDLWKRTVRNSILGATNGAPSSHHHHSGAYFDDGRRKVDFVLMFEENLSEGDGENADEVGRRKRRQFFEENLTRAGLELEKDEHKRQDTPDAPVFLSVFIKVHAPWPVLCQYAEELKMRSPLQLQDAFAGHLDGRGLSRRNLQRFLVKSIHCIFEFFEKIISSRNRSEEQHSREEVTQPSLYPASIWLMPLSGKKTPADSQATKHVTWPFQRRRIKKFLVNDMDTFFTPTQRMEMVWEILQRAKNDPNDEKKRGLEPLLAAGVYQEAFALHDGPCSTKSDSNQTGCDRQRLRGTWANWRSIFRRQPIELIRSYYGEKVAFYFCFLGFYTRMLIYPAIVGVTVFIYGTIYAENSEVVKSICDGDNDPGNRIMCPICKLPNCDFTSLSDGCINVTWEYRVDNPATVALACFTVVWATVFLKLWKRRESELAYQWDTSGVELVDFSVRPEYEECATERRPNQITGEIEPYVPFSRRFGRAIVSTLVTLLILCAVGVALVALILARIQLYGVLKGLGIKRHVDLSRWIVHALTFVVVSLFEWAYNRIGEKTTSWECPRTRTAWMASYLWKMSLFQLMNHFLPIAYSCWIKGKTAQSFQLSWASELCETGGCMSEATELIAVLLVARLVIGNATEIGIPFLKKLWSKFQDRRVQARGNNRRFDNDSQWHQDALLDNLEQDGVAKEYMEMIVQFAFCTLFVPAFPAAPIVCLLNNILEIRVDAINFITAHRRPLPVRVSGIEIWNTFLDIIAKLAILCNAGLISFTSGIVPRLYYEYRLSDDGTLGGFPLCSLSFLEKDKWTEKEQIHFSRRNLTGCWFENRLNDTACSKFIMSPEEELEDEMWWEIMTMRVIAFALFAISSFIFQWLFNFLIPDTPARVTIKAQRRRYVVTKAMESEMVYDRWLKHAFNRAELKQQCRTELENQNNLIVPMALQGTEETGNGLVWDVDDGEDLMQIPSQDIHVPVLYKRR